MQLLDLTLPDAAANVALDEALLEEAELSAEPREVLRLWEPASAMVVMGRSSRPEIEIDLEVCAQRRVPVIRRTSGGLAIVTGPGCLMYSLVLSLEQRPQLRGIDQIHCHVLGRMVETLALVAPGTVRCGTSDLAFAAEERGASTAGAACDLPQHRQQALRKFSGNSLRVKRRHVLYHGTLLYDFDLRLVEQLLRHPPREPGYRAGRSHGEFVANLPSSREQLRAAVLAAWQPAGQRIVWPAEQTKKLVAEKYSQAAWNAEGNI